MINFYGPAAIPASAYTFDAFQHYECVKRTKHLSATHYGCNKQCRCTPQGPLAPQTLLSLAIVHNFNEAKDQACPFI